ncbi:hypothetical protein PsorP6_007438 [Peronosclerospora sorghi]|uniref:Uncharacterized protein n=1 Tax=Peronosclerospora sorghi TaxID=230839 RepID=A0ACC0W8P9_9STRA|nr:hypothetical protein PsorP6_007438 [Peronosclerospora sorghi]
MLLVLRKEAKQSSEKVLDLLEKVKLLETDLVASARTLEEKDKEVSRLTNALARIEEENEELRLQIKQRLVVTEEKEIALQEKISELEKQMNARELEHQSMVKTLENHLVATQQELYTKNEAWNEKLASAERPGACLIAEHSQLCDEVSRLRREVEVARQAKDAQAEEKVKAQESCSEQVETMQRELEAANALWAQKQHDLYEEIEKEISELQEKYTAAQTQHATYEAKLTEMEALLEMSENEVIGYLRELKSLAESLQSAEKQAATYHDELMVAQVAKESMEQLIAKQKARIDKLDKVKMTTEIFDLFQTLKKARADLQVKVCNLQKNLAQAEAALALRKGKGNWFAA